MATSTFMTMAPQKVFRCLCIALVVTSCATQPPRSATNEEPGTAATATAAAPSGAGMRELREVTVGPAAEDAAPFAAPRAQEQRRPSELYPGTGQFIDEQAASPPAYNRNRNGDITLNFDGADLVEVVRTILGDILGQNYTVDPTVQGVVTLQTSRPVSEDALVGVLETLLKVNGAVLIREDDLWRVLPAAEVSGTTLTPTLRPVPQRGYQVVVVPLRYIAAEEMQKILQLVQGREQTVQADPKRNFLLLSGTQQELSRLLETIEIFDVDQFEGMSFGLFRLTYVDAEGVRQELEQIFTEMQLPMSGMVRFVPIERMNALIAITPQRKYLDDVGTWIERLDQAELVTGVDLFVYRVQNRNAARLAELLQELFSAAAEREAEPEQESPVAPALTPTETESQGAAETEGQQLPRVQERPPPAEPGVGTAFDVGNAQVIADEENNALLIMATGADYRKIERALKRLDVLPLQVLIEASIVDVILSDELEFGVEWFVEHSLDGAEGEARFDLGEMGIGAASGFSYSVVGAAEEFQVVLNALAEESRVNVLSSPSLMVLDNRTAEIRVGNQQPVQTETATTEGGVIVESVQFKDTGVLLTVTPRVNVGGLVTLEISQEVTDVGDIDAATGQRSFLQRNITSTVAVQSGQTVVLGGLITENTSVSDSGVPLLYKLPLVGRLFGTTERSERRNELIVLITPQVVENPEAAQEVIRDFRNKMQNLKFDLWDRMRGRTLDGGAARPEDAEAETVSATGASPSGASAQPAPVTRVSPSPAPTVAEEINAGALAALEGDVAAPALPSDAGVEPMQDAIPVAPASTDASAEPPPSDPPAPAQDHPSKTSGGVSAEGLYRVQLSATRTSLERVLEAWSALRDAHPDLLAGLAPTIEDETRQGSDEVWHRLQAGPLPSRAAANQLCRELKRRGTDGCFPVQRGRTNVTP